MQVLFFFLPKDGKSLRDHLGFSLHAISISTSESD